MIKNETYIIVREPQWKLRKLNHQSKTFDIQRLDKNSINMLKTDISSIRLHLKKKKNDYREKTHLNLYHYSYICIQSSVDMIQRYDYSLLKIKIKLPSRNLALYNVHVKE